MRTNYDLLKVCDCYIWGNGNLIRRYWWAVKNFKVVAIIDSNPEKWGTFELDTKLVCITPDAVSKNATVIVAIENPIAIAEVGRELDKQEIKWLHIIEAVDSFFLQDMKDKDDFKSGLTDKIVKFIDTMVPVSNCNLNCNYCYLHQLGVDNSKLPQIYHHAKFIRYALRRERLGGIAFINLCGVGETLLFAGLLSLVRELVKEGHYIQIVTNATITKVINDFLASDIDPGHVFFKCSLHYQELKERNLLRNYADNVNRLISGGYSITIELVPEDSIVEEINDIKKYCSENFGALPHVTVTRDESYEDNRIATKYSEEEYEKIWGQFDSSMFALKMRYRYRYRYRYCYAGLWAAELNLATGELYKCTNNPRLCNIYEDPERPIPFEAVGNKCALPYCFNCHAYLTLGLIPEIKTSNYLEMRDKVMSDGGHWITGAIRNIFEQKLYDNNV